MEVFTVSVGIGRVAISVCRTRQVVSRLHADIYHDCWKSAHHHKRYTLSGLTPLCRDSGDVAPSDPYMHGATVFKLAGLIRLAKSNAFETSEPARTAYPRIRGQYLSLSDSSGSSNLSTSIDLRPQPFSTGCANLAPLCQIGELPPCRRVPIRGNWLVPSSGHRPRHRKDGGDRRPCGQLGFRCRPQAHTEAPLRIYSQSHGCRKDRCSSVQESGPKKGGSRDKDDEPWKRARKGDGPRLSG